MREAAAASISYDPRPLANLAPDGLYLLYGPRRVGKTVSIKRAIAGLLADGVDALRICRVSVDGWRANRLGALYEYVTRVATGAAGDAPRFWFFDEITTTHGPWWSVIKDLRDNTALRHDCVVLTGSSNRGLDEAIKALAGRRGSALDPDRALLPMTFAHFCAAAGIAIPVDRIRPNELRTRVAREAWLDLALHTDALVAAWRAFLETGGYPQAVGDWRRRGSVTPQTTASIWDAIRGEALTDGVAEPTTAAVLEGVARRLTATTALAQFARDVGISAAALQARLEALDGAFVSWSCPAADERGRPQSRRLRKRYFYDALVARLPELLHGAAPVALPALNEQQLGVELVAWCERVASGSVRTDVWVMHSRPASGEIDFYGTCPDTRDRMTALEAKYVSGAWRREALRIRNSGAATGVLATHDVLDVDPEEPVWAVPASFVAYAIGRSPP